MKKNQESLETKKVSEFTLKRIEQIQNIIQEKPLASYSEIGKKIGVSKQCIHAFMQKHFSEFLEKKESIKQKLNEKNKTLEKNSLTEESLIKILITKHLLEENIPPCGIIKQLGLNNTKFYNWKKKFVPIIEHKIQNYNESVKQAKVLYDQDFKSYFIAKSCRTKKEVVDKWIDRGFKKLPIKVSSQLLKEYLNN